MDQNEHVQFGGAGIIGNKSINYNVPLKRSTFFFEKILFHPETEVERIMNSSLSGIILIIRIPTKITEKYNLVTIDEANMKKNRKVTRLLIKIVLLGDKPEYYSINDRRKRVDSEKGFIREVDVQRYLFKRSLQNGVPICPSIMYSAIIQNYSPIFDKFKKIKSPDYKKLKERIFNGLESAIKKMKSKPKMGIIGMELAENYVPVGDMKRITKGVYNEIIKKFYIMYSYGFIHNDEHMNNIMYNPKTKYALIIDFGRTVKFLEHRYDNFKFYLYNTRLGDWYVIGKMIPNIDESKIDFDINNLKSIPEIFRGAGLDTENYTLLDDNLIKFNYGEYNRYRIKKRKTKKAKAVVNGCKGLSPSACTAKSGCKIARGTKRTFCRSEGNRKKQREKTRSVTQKASKKPAQAQAQVKGCKGLSPSVCQAKTGCKVARGAKRTFCRNATNKKK
jgi:hypothetical protein